MIDKHCFMHRRDAGVVRAQAQKSRKEAMGSNKERVARAVASTMTDASMGIYIGEKEARRSLFRIWWRRMQA